MLNQEQTKLLANLKVSPGWKILESIINEKVDSLRNRLESDIIDNIIPTQNELKAYKFVLRIVNEGEKNAK